jgi:hypothetical protein
MCECCKEKDDIIHILKQQNKNLWGLVNENSISKENNIISQNLVHVLMMKNETLLDEDVIRLFECRKFKSEISKFLHDVMSCENVICNSKITFMENNKIQKTNKVQFYKKVFIFFKKRFQNIIFKKHEECQENITLKNCELDNVRIENYKLFLNML